MTVRVRIIFWAEVKGSKSRWNREAFDAAGCEVEVTDNPLISSIGADLIFTPIPGLPRGPIPILSQFAGYGTRLVLPNTKFSKYAAETFKNSIAVTLLDPNFLVEMQRCGLEGETFMVPNAAPPLEPIPSGEHEGFNVLIPSGTVWFKKPELMIEAIRMVGREDPSVRFWLPGAGRVWRAPMDWLKHDNLRVVPRKTLKGMMELYYLADVVWNYSAAEIQPQTSYEAWLFGKPLVVNKLGMTQSVHRRHLRRMTADFGKPSEEFHERWRGKYLTGDHYVRAETPEEMAEAIMKLHGDEKARLKLGLKGREWIDEYDEHWSLKDRGKTLLRVAGFG